MAVVSASIACRSSRSRPAGAAHGQVQVVQSVLSAAPRTRARLGSRLTHTGARSAATHSRRARAALAAATHWQQPHTGSSHTLAAATLQARAGEAATHRRSSSHTLAAATLQARAGEAGRRAARARARTYLRAPPAAHGSVGKGHGTLVRTGRGCERGQWRLAWASAFYPSRPLNVFLPFVTWHCTVQFVET